jgi:hypothetical protein
MKRRRKSKAQPFLYHGSPDIGVRPRLMPQPDVWTGEKRLFGTPLRSIAAMYTTGVNPLAGRNPLGIRAYEAKSGRDGRWWRGGRAGLSIPKQSQAVLDQPAAIYALPKRAGFSAHQLDESLQSTTRAVRAIKSRRFKTVRDALKWGRVVVTIRS